MPTAKEPSSHDEDEGEVYSSGVPSLKIKREEFSIGERAGAAEAGGRGGAGNTHVSD